MSIKTTIHDNLDYAIRERKAHDLPVLRAMLSEISSAEVAGKTRRELDDAEIVAILRRMMKQRQESAEIYSGAGEKDRAFTEMYEASLIDAFIPESFRQIDTEATRALVTQIVADAGLRPPFTPKMNGVVMGQLKSRQDVDKKLAASLVREVVEARA